MNKMTCLNDNLIKVIGANEKNKYRPLRYASEEIRFSIYFKHLFILFSLHLPYDIDQPLIQVESDPRNKSVPILEPF